MEESNNIFNTPPVLAQQTPRRKNFLRSVWEFVKVILIALLIVLPIRYFIFQPFIVKGESMVPNFQSGDYLIVDEVSYKFGEPQRGDVIVFYYPVDTTQRFIKRIIGLPGETVEVKDEKVIITKGEETIILDEKKYLPDSFVTLGNIRLTLTEDQYFVMGDNRQFSYDSRMWGVLPERDIIGKALFRVLPLQNMSLIPQGSY